MQTVETSQWLLSILTSSISEFFLSPLLVLGNDFFHGVEILKRLDSCPKGIKSKTTDNASMVAADADACTDGSWQWNQQLKFLQLSS